MGYQMLKKISAKITIYILIFLFILIADHYFIHKYINESSCLLCQLINAGFITHSFFQLIVFSILIIFVIMHEPSKVTSLKCLNNQLRAPPVI